MLASRFAACLGVILLACAPALAPMPPGAFEPSADPAAEAFRSSLPADAERIHVPSWAKLSAVWGIYDPPFVTEPLEVAQVLFGKDPRQLLILRRSGELLVWDRVSHATRARLNGCSVERLSTAGVAPRSASLLVTSADQPWAAIGFSSGRYCLLDLSTGNKLVELEANVLDRGGLMVARIAGQTLITYAYQPAATEETSLRSIYLPEAGGELRSWDARTGKKLSDVNVGGALYAALSPDGQRLAFVSMQRGVAGKLHLADRSGRVLWTSDEPTNAVEFAGHDELLASDGQRLFTVSARDGKTRGRLEGYWRPMSDYPFRNMVVTPDGRHAVTAFQDGRFTLWDVGARREVAHIMRDWPDQPSLHRAYASPDGSMFVAADGSIMSTAKLDLIAAPSGPIECLAVSREGSRAVTCHGQRRTRVFDLWDARRQDLRRWPRRDAAFTSLTPDGACVLIRERESNTLRDFATGLVLWSAPHYLWAPAALAPSSDRVALLHWSAETNRFWTVMRDVRTGKMVWQNDQERPRDRVLDFSPDGATLVAHDESGDLVILDSNDGSPRRRVRVGNQGVAQLTLIDTHQALLVGEYGESLEAYDFQLGKPRWHTVEKSSVIQTAAITDAFFVILLSDRTIRLRSTATGKELEDPIDLEPSGDRPRFLATSGDGQALFVGTQRGVLLRFQLQIPSKP